jgi:adenine-specific DNA-methyltransferase
MVIKNTSSTTINNKSIGQFFTPGYIAEFMVKNIISYVKKPKKDFPTLKILEPSVGEGIFLKYLLKNNLFNITAYEMDEDLKEILLNSYPNIDFKFENFLGSKSKEKYDIIIGNPPYLGQNYNAEIFQQYIRRFPFCAKYFVGNMDLFYFFIHLGIEKLKPGGVLSFITTNYWITKSRKTGIKFLKPHVLDECFLLQYIDFSYLQLFDNAKGQQNCIFVLQKKNEDEKKQKINKKIEIIHFIENKEISQNNKLANNKIFKNLTYGKFFSKIKIFTSAITNNDLIKDESWNLIYPKEVKYIVEKIENYCKVNKKLSLLKDYFLIRNGLILIKDSIFILNEGIDIKTNQYDIFIRINGEFLKLSEIEKSRLKKIYKSKSIKAYGYEKDKHTGYLIYFNKNEFKQHSNLERNHLINDKYPLLSKYIKQYENELKDILINAKENPHDFYFPRRGAFIRQFDANSNEKLTDLEPFYDHAEKIFFKYISKDNTFGYSNTSYYATSDTYFLWPKYPENKVDYLFFLAYLNSSIVNFIYKAKNISIKRSKTKLEQGLSMPNLKNFERGEKKDIIELIRMLTLHLIDDSDIQLPKDMENYIDKITPDNCFKAKIIEASRSHDRHYLKKAIDKLFFQLFDLDEKLVANLLNEYYNH